MFVQLAMARSMALPLLNLGRLVGESVTLEFGGEKATITITEARGGKVRLSIQAPKSVKVSRQKMGESHNGRSGNEP